MTTPTLYGPYRSMQNQNAVSISSGLNNQLPSALWQPITKVITALGATTLVPTDQFVCTRIGGAATLSLPANPAPGELHMICSLQAGDAVTVNGNGYNILASGSVGAGAPTVVIAAGSRHVYAFQGNSATPSSGLWVEVSSS